MSIKRILVPLKGADNDAGALDLAFQVAGTFDAEVAGLFVRPDPGEALPFLGDGISGAVIEDLLTAAKEGADAASARAKTFLEDAAAKAQSARGRFLEKTGPRAETIGEAARLADLVVFPYKPDEGEQAGGEALETVLISDGRPVMLAPHTPPGTVGKTVAIGWDESAEAAHAVGAAMPFLGSADRVRIFRVGGKDLDPEPGARLSEYLGLHGVEAGVHLVEQGERSIGEALIDAAEKDGADLLVIGGYAHSRLREFVLGGTTRYVRSHVVLPVLMAH